ncbi:hypothetical protein [Paraglaciecola sp.]|uniref:hypothetical protein n=1 Tax=Paraglaciecola sp. TaxID=1920173 RepID=UPI0030F3760E
MFDFSIKNTTKFTLAFIITTSLFACGGNDSAQAPIIDEPPIPSGPSFSFAGLKDRIIYDLDNIDGQLFAATDKGLYKEVEVNKWQLIGHDTWVIKDWEIMADGRWIVSTSDADSLVGLPTRYDVYESLDDGQTWQKVEHNFGGNTEPDAEPERIFKFTEDSAVLFAVGYASLGRSYNSGHSWELLDGFWHGFSTGLNAVILSPDRTNIWYGGQGAIENLVLTRYQINSGISTNLSDKTTDLLPTPSVVKNILFDPINSQRIFVCAEGGIIQSTDEGETWQAFFLNNDHRFYFDMAADPSQQGRFFTAGWAKTPEAQPLTLDVSSDDGQNWTSYPHPDKSIYGGVYSIISRIESGKTVVYLGTFKGGLIRVTDFP